MTYFREADLFPYQRAGREFLAARDKALLLDAPGVGKTVQACAALDAVGAKRVGVICPAVARTVWKRHVEEWAPGVEVLHVESFEKWTRPNSRLAEMVRNDAPLDVLIVDEAHYLKSPTSKRTQAVYGNAVKMKVKDKALAACAERVWCLSGTLMPNHAAEAWTHLRGLWGEGLAYNAFMERYCYVRHSDYGPVVMGNRKERLPELREKIMSHALRRRQEDVLPELPPLMFSEWPVDPFASLDKAMLREDAKYAKPLKDLLYQWGAGTFTDEEAMFAIRESEVHLSTLRRYLGVAKALTVSHAIADELREDPDMAVILFAAHLDVIEELWQTLQDFNPAKVTGATTDSVRDNEIDRFQNDPRCRVFIGQIKACQTALTLTRANNVVIVEPEWTPEFNFQAAKRAHRIGQTRPVFVRFAMMPRTLDEAIGRVLVRKTKMIAQILD